METSLIPNFTKNMNIIFFFSLLGIIIWSLFEPKIPILIPVLIYIVLVLVRANEKIYNYFDDEKQSKVNEARELKYQIEKLYGQGGGDSSVKEEYKKRIREKYELGRRKEKRKFLVELINTLYFKQ